MKVWFEMETSWLGGEKLLYDGPERFRGQVRGDGDEV
jgi:hypothetical protein